jgi:hypothetical protein
MMPVWKLARKERKEPMNVSPSSRIVALTVLLVAIGACSSGPPSLSDLKVGKDKEVKQPANAFAAHDTVYAEAKIENPPKDGKVVGRLVVVDVPGQQAGPIPGLEKTIDLTGPMNTASFDFTAPTAGWPDGKYKIEVVLLDGSGANKGEKSVEFTTSGNQTEAPAAAATSTEAPATETTQT